MFRNRLFYVFVIVALVVVAALTIRLAVATSEVVSGPSSHAGSTPDQRERSANQSTGNSARAYRNPLAACFDVPLREAAACRKADQAPIKSTVNHTRAYRNPLLDECFDVPLREAAACREAGGTAIQSPESHSRLHRHPLDECFDVPLREAARCDK